MKRKYKFFWGGVFSNWCPSKFTVDGVEFNCGEQYMMYQKAVLFNDMESAKKILAAETPKEQKALGRGVKNFDTDIWNELSYDLVKTGLREKFQQNPDLKKELLANKGKVFVEASPFDSIWGVGFNEHDAPFNYEKWGENRLGKILTELSQEL